MFAKAIQDHSPVKKTGRSANALKPVSTTALNTTRSVWPTVHNSLKRTAAQANLKAPKLMQQSSGTSSESLGNGGRVVQLHDVVSWDENDFVNDEDIDLDAEEPSFNSTVSYPTLPDQEKILYPNLSPTTKTTIPASSTDIPWSSSPEQHKLARAPQPVPQATNSITNKRRKLPWDSESQEPNTVGQNNGQRFGPSKAIQEVIHRAKSGNISERSTTSTPAPKYQTDSPLPWNITASAVKEDQKKLRQSRKKVSGELGGEHSGEMKTNPKRVTRIPRIYLSEEQRKILTLVTKQKKSVFFTGSAGTGKSVLMREIIKTLRTIHKTQPDRIAITASTGLAACNVGGVTLHSFAGIGLGKEDVPTLVKKIKRNPKAKNRWMRTQVLVIDEISMVDGELFDKLEGVARSIRNNGRPFGGIQLVITGDFFQLPPVPDSGKIAKFSFDAATWNTSIEHTIGLTQVFRQKDPVFANMLNEMRLGRLTSQSIEVFRSLDRPLSSDNQIAATELYVALFYGTRLQH